MQSVLTPELTAVLGALPNRLAISIILPIKSTFSSKSNLLHKLIGLKEDRQTQLLNLLDQTVNQQKRVVGINDVWLATQSNKGEKLLLESEFICSVLPAINKDDRFANYPDEPSIFTPNAMNDIISRLLPTAGYRFTEPNFLTNTIILH